MTPAYRYNATLLKVVDGDTVDLRVDCGFRIWIEDRFRLYGINAPEMNNPDGSGVKARDYLFQLLVGGFATIVVETFKPKDKYGRWLGILHVTTGEGEIVVNDAMVSSGHAVPYMV